MALDPDKKVLARFIDTADGLKYYATACGKNLCTDEDPRLLGRFVDVASGFKVFAVASEGCQPPLDLTASEIIDGACWTEKTGPLGYAEAGCFPPRGISTLIRVRMHAFSGCADLDCLASYLIYNEPAAHTNACLQTVPDGQGWWSGCVGGLTLELHCNGSGQLIVCYSGCDTMPGSFILAQSPDCLFDDTAGAGAQIQVGECCDCYGENGEGGIITLTFKGYCGNRRAARFVDVADGVKVYAVGGCDDDDACQPFTDDCCEALKFCPLTVEMTSAGCCEGLSGVRTFEVFDHSGSPLKWRPSGGSISTCGINWFVELQCAPHPVSGVASFRMIISTSGPQCSCTPDTVYHEISGPPCLPLEESWSMAIACEDLDPYDAVDCCSPTVDITVTF